jgi:hypothetical protein
MAETEFDRLSSSRDFTDGWPCSTCNHGLERHSLPVPPGTAGALAKATSAPSTGQHPG